MKTFRIGDPPKRGEGLRIAVTRRPPRGIPRVRWQAEGLFDVWYPGLAPSAALLHSLREAQKKAGDPKKVFATFLARYERELLASAETRQALELMAALSRRTPLAVGCFCEDERYCHRSRLWELIAKFAA